MQAVRKIRRGKTAGKKVYEIVKGTRNGDYRMMDIENYTKEELLAMNNFGEHEKFTGVVIVPMDTVHDSGFKCMKFILTNHGAVVGAVSGWSDVIHLNGIGGYGKTYDIDKEYVINGLAKRIDWKIDCLAKSGCLRLFNRELLEIDDFIGSDFIIYPVGDHES